jgi:hypothetical protein
MGMVHAKIVKGWPPAPGSPFYFAQEGKQMTTNEQEVVHYADDKKGGRSTLCGKTIPPAKASMMDKEITCELCRGQLNWRAIPNRPSP